MSRRLPLLAVVISLSSPASTLAQSEGLGLISFLNSGAEAAQEPFLRGVLLLHNFEYEDAAEAFREAQAADPEFALAYWGEALTWQRLLWGQDFLEQAREALGSFGPTPEARSAKAPTDRERLYLSAVETLLGAGTEAERTRRYQAAMRRLHAAYPEDDEAAALHALSILWAGEYGRPRTAARSAAILERIARRNPYHPGAVHYLIHSYDSPEMAPLGLHWARVYSRLAPAAEHALHMPSHIFINLGLWDEVAASNEASTAASRAWVRRKGLGVMELDFHSFQWLSYAYLQQGRYREGKAIVDSVRALLQGRDVAGRHWNVANGANIATLQWGVETGDWSSFQSSELPEPGRPSARLRYTLPLYGAGMAAATQGDAARASEVAARLRALRADGEPASTGREILALHVEAVAALYQGEAERAVEISEKAAALAEPLLESSPAIFHPSFELYGQILLVAERAEEAAAAFDRALERSPGRSQSLLGRARAAAAGGDRATAAHYYRLLLHNWRLADEDLPGFEEAQRYARP